ncbi:hypothetical protein CIB87_27425 [Priestia megaterium]|uniref:Uncharacterized protein n=1 Tax=Priestia megaterium TaxID=1404 RepID=A0AA86IET3_PRIMG|nr:hypothetical protein CIB87_27425 [Priestia megaterium]
MFFSFIFLSLINVFISISLGYTAYQLFRKAFIGGILTDILTCSAPIIFVWPSLFLSTGISLFLYFLIIDSKKNNSLNT